ncbi:MAG: PAS domain S-box protein, partial [Verrucomicrobiae bacterium]
MDQKNEDNPTPEVSVGAPCAKALLRQKAEAQFRKREMGPAEKLEDLTPEARGEILHELRVHQIEMEMQNEELLQAHAELEASRALYFDLYDLAPVGYITVSGSGMILQANLTAARLLGTTRTALVKTPLAQHILSKDQDIVYRLRKALIETGEPQQCDLRMVKKHGAATWTHLEATAAQDDAGSPVCRVVLGDISVRKAAEEDLINLRTAVEQSACTVIITAPDGSIEYANLATEKTTGYTRAEIAGENPRIFKSGEQDAEYYRNLWTTIQSGNIWRGEFHNRRKDGSFYWESATISPVLDDRGEIHHFIAVKEDITERKLMEARLAEALRRAEASAVAKSEFLSVVSHELRTPLNGVLGFAELLTYTPLDKKQKQFAETISASGNLLLAIVNDILDFSSIESGKLAVQTAPISLSELVGQSAAAARKLAADKGLGFVCEVASGAPEQIAGDARRIRQILTNILGNAVKFTSSGSVAFRVAPSSEKGWQLLDFSIEDTGIGISPETLRRLFVPFTQANSTNSRPFGGTGLGLAISKRLAEAMGGGITVTSALGKGSVFTFQLPL